MGSYRDILRATRLKKDYDNYQAWNDLDPEDRSAAYDSVAKDNRYRYDKVDAYIAPFNQPAKTLYVKVKIPAAGATSAAATARSLLGAYFTATEPAGATDIIVQPSFFPASKLAAMTVVTRTTTATAKTPSRITKRPYKRHRSNNATVHFGKNAAADGYDDAVRAIRALAAFDTHVATPGNLILFTPEDA